MITSAACRTIVNGVKNVFPCHRHADFYLWMKLLHCDYDKNSVEQGFIDWNEEARAERFVSRQEAYEIAINSGQLKCPTDTPGNLFSEDLY